MLTALEYETSVVDLRQTPVPRHSCVTLCLSSWCCKSCMTEMAKRKEEKNILQQQRKRKMIMSKEINVRREVAQIKIATVSHWELLRVIQQLENWLWNNFCKAACWVIQLFFFFWGGSGQEYCLSQQEKILLQKREEKWQQTAPIPIEMHWVKKVTRTDTRTWSTCNSNVISTYVAVLFKQLRDLRKRH